MGYVSDHYGTPLAYAIPLASFVVIFLYSVYLERERRRSLWPARSEFQKGKKQIKRSRRKPALFVQARNFARLLGFWSGQRKDYRNLYLFDGAVCDILTS
ncbi:Uncharacterised protein [Chromobacterium violaceum]|uniref:Uncharacterized protein n=1 Tax=Chromobacterium violaceum TaxID=536 RepID=A0A447TCS9_CHRVL|nr:Uncharacterised protein [Chromobacterium violaceum]